MMFQVLDMKGNQFLNLIDSDNNLFEPLYIRERPWLQNFEHSNFLYMRASRTITNHASIGKYRLRFFLNKEFRCPCSQYPIESRYYNWNSRRNSIVYFVMFLE